MQCTYVPDVCVGARACNRQTVVNQMRIAVLFYSKGINVKYSLFYINWICMPTWLSMTKTATTTRNLWGYRLTALLTFFGFVSKLKPLTLCHKVQTKPSTKFKKFDNQLRRGMLFHTNLTRKLIQRFQHIRIILYKMNEFTFEHICEANSCRTESWWKIQASNMMRCIFVSETFVIYVGL